MAEAWSAVLARLGTPTGDGRVLVPGGITNRDLPLPLMWQRKTEDGHGGAVIVGRIEEMSYLPDMVTATGTLFESAETGEVRTLIEGGVVGPSVDLDDIDYVMDDSERIIVTQGRIAGATLVPIPAFADVSISLTPEVSGEVTEVPYGKMSVWNAGTVNEPSTDAGAVRESYAELASTSDVGTGSPCQTSSVRTAKPSFLPDGATATPSDVTSANTSETESLSTPEHGRAERTQTTASVIEKTAHGGGGPEPSAGDSTNTPHAGGEFSESPTSDGNISQSFTSSKTESAESAGKSSSSPQGPGQTYPRISTMTTTQGRSEGGSVDRATVDSGRSETTLFYSMPGRLGFVSGGPGSSSPRWNPRTGQQFADAGNRRPPLEWFRNPNLSGPTPLTITEEGRVFGTIAPWDQCHVGLPGCVTPPASYSEYAYFLTGAEKTAEGVTVPVGKLTVGGGHAHPDAGFRAAAEHYDDVGTAVASVFAGEDEYGVWVAGYVLPDATQEQVDSLQRSPLSGDWRRIGGSLELVAAHAVNVPGFPVPRAKVKFSLGEQRSLIAHFKVAPAPEPQEEPEPQHDKTLAAKARWAWTKEQI